MGGTKNELTEHGGREGGGWWQSIEHFFRYRNNRKNLKQNE